MISEAEFSLIRRASALECELEVLEGRLSRDEPVDLDSFGRGTSHLRRLLETLQGMACSAGHASYRLMRHRYPDDEATPRRRRPTTTSGSSPLARRSRLSRGVG